MQTIPARLIPYDKSWLIRMGVLDLIYGQPEHALEVLDGLDQELGSDLVALRQALVDWPTKGIIDVGESGTLLRLLKFTNWKQGSGKTFLVHGTLKTRAVCDDPEIINWSASELLKLDGGTSQWASAAALNGSTERLKDPPYKLALTYEAAFNYQRDRQWQPRPDETIERQAKAFLSALRGGPLDFQPLQAEDYCFARAFDLMTAEEGESRWPALRNHESDRITEMERELTSETINSLDHRVIQAVVMRRVVDSKPHKTTHPRGVRKSWPQFWDFIEWAKK